jgi:hypothetical protein
LIFDSEEDEKVYGMGLQYTVTDFKGHLVNMISSEGGVGRGLQPLTDMLNTENKNQGGSELTTYSPAYSFGTSFNRGIVMQNHTNIGHIDFRRKNSFNILLWKTSSSSTNVSLKLISGGSLKNVISGITSIVGRMKKLP